MIGGPSTAGVFPKPKAIRYRQIEMRNQRVQSILHMGRKGWKREQGYHQRSLAESGMAPLQMHFGAAAGKDSKPKGRPNVAHSIG